MRDIYTNSMLKDWKSCKQKYYYKYIKKILIPKREDNFELGKKVHALISYKLNGYDTNMMLNNVDDEVLKHYNSILRHPILEKTFFKSEWGFNASIANLPALFTGRVDAIFFDKNENKYIIADWKTGMNIPKIPAEDFQAQIYLYSFYRCRKDLKLDIKPENLKFIFIQTPSLNESSVDFSTELYEKFENNFIKIIDEIKKYKHDKISEENSACKFCEYKFLCFKN